MSACAVPLSMSDLIRTPTLARACPGAELNVQPSVVPAPPPTLASVAPSRGETFLSGAEPHNSPRDRLGDLRRRRRKADIMSSLQQSSYSNLRERRVTSYESMLFQDCYCRGYRLLGTTLGGGSFGKIRLAICEKRAHSKAASPKSPTEFMGEKVVVKILDKRMCPPEAWSLVPQRIRTHRMVTGHPFIVTLHETFETASHLYQVSEFCGGGTLAAHLERVQPDEARVGLQEAEARRMFTQLVRAVQHCHARNVVLRDVRTDTLLLDAAENLKLSDFSGAEPVLSIHKLLREPPPAGVAPCAAPEMINHQVYQGDKVDVWATGVVLYTLLHNRAPFSGATPRDVYDNMRQQRLQFHASVSTEAMLLLHGMLQPDPQERATLAHVEASAWFQGKNLSTADTMAMAANSTTAGGCVRRGECVSLPVPHYSPPPTAHYTAAVSVGQETIFLKSKRSRQPVAPPQTITPISSRCIARSPSVTPRVIATARDAPKKLQAKSTPLLSRPEKSRVEVSSPSACCEQRRHIKRTQPSEEPASPPQYNIIDATTCEVTCDCGRVMTLKLKKESPPTHATPTPNNSPRDLPAASDEQLKDAADEQTKDTVDEQAVAALQVEVCSSICLSSEVLRTPSPTAARPLMVKRWINLDERVRSIEDDLVAANESVPPAVEAPLPLSAAYAGEPHPVGGDGSEFSAVIRRMSQANSPSPSSNSRLAIRSSHSSSVEVRTSHATMAASELGSEQPCSRSSAGSEVATNDTTPPAPQGRTPLPPPDVRGSQSPQFSDEVIATLVATETILLPQRAVSSQATPAAASLHEEQSSSFATSSASDTSVSSFRAVQRERSSEAAAAAQLATYSYESCARSKASKARRSSEASSQASSSGCRKRVRRSRRRGAELAAAASAPAATVQAEEVPEVARHASLDGASLLPPLRDLSGAARAHRISAAKQPVQLGAFNPLSVLNRRYMTHVRHDPAVPYTRRPEAPDDVLIHE